VLHQLLQRVYADFSIMVSCLTTSVEAKPTRILQMNFKSRFAGFSSGTAAHPPRNWVMGWTLDEARTAAQQNRTVKPSSGKPGARGGLVIANNR
jgi:hypothetical protein